MDLRRRHILFMLFISFSFCFPITLLVKCFGAIGSKTLGQGAVQQCEIAKECMLHFCACALLGRKKMQQNYSKASEPEVSKSYFSREWFATRQRTQSNQGKFLQSYMKQVFLPLSHLLNNSRASTERIAQFPLLSAYALYMHIALIFQTHYWESDKQISPPTFVFQFMLKDKVNHWLYSDFHIQPQSPISILK